MTRSTAGLAVVLGLTLGLTPSLVRAAPPQLKETSPLGLQKGVEADLTLSGSNLTGHPQLVAPFAFTPSAEALPGSDASNWKLKLTVAPETAIGVYPIRVRTDEGLSNPILFSIGQLPQVAEKEDNSAFELAQVIPPLAVVEGKSADNDVDYFRFPGKKGQRILIDAQCARIGSGVDPSIRLTTASRTFIASADDSPGLVTDARLTAVLPEDTDYVIELSDSRYQGGTNPVYRLVVGAVPMADEVYPIGGRSGETVGLELRGGTLNDRRIAAATLNPASDARSTPIRLTNQTLGVTSPGDPILDVESLPPLAASVLPELREPSDPNAAPVRAAAPVALNGRIDPAGDEDRFAVAVTPGQKYHIEVDAYDNGSALDGVLRVLGAKDAVLATADDTPIPLPTKQGQQKQTLSSPDPSVDFTVPSDLHELTLALRDLEGRGGIGFPYRITITPVLPSFDVVLNDAQIGVPRNGSAAIGVTITRKGYTGPITLSVANPPPGLSVRPGTIGEAQMAGTFTVSAAPDAPFGAVNLDIIGQSQPTAPTGPIVEHATKPIVFSMQKGMMGNAAATLPTNTLTQYGLACAPTLTAPLRLETAETPVEVPHGAGAPIVVKVERPAGAEGALNLTALTPPIGLTTAAASIAEKATEGTVTINAAPEAGLGITSLVLVAKGKIAGAEQTLTVPAVTLNVVRPVALELAAPGVEVKAGETVELKGKVVRKGTFKEPLTIKLSGLPAGLKVEPVAVAADQSEFTARIVAEPTAAAASASANVAPAFQINKKDYVTPPVALSVKVLAASK
jgi:hypothetical protein